MKLQWPTNIFILNDRVEQLRNWKCWSDSWGLVHFLDECHYFHNILSSSVFTGVNQIMYFSNDAQNVPCLYPPQGMHDPKVGESCGFLESVSLYSVDTWEFASEEKLQDEIFKITRESKAVRFSRIGSFCVHWVHTNISEMLTSPRTIINTL